MSWISRIANVFRRERTAADLEDELQFHLSQRTDDLVRGGITHPEAELAARRRLGNPLLLRESSYDVKAAAWLDSLLRDLRFGLRMLRKNPGFTALAVMTLALGIGATTAVFSLVNAVLLRSLPYRQPEQLVFLFEPNPHIPGIPLLGFGPYPGDFYDWQKQSRAFTNLALFTTDRMNLAVDQSAVRVDGARVTGDFFQVLGIAPELGRTAQAEDDQPGKEQVAVISHALWQSRFGADRGVLGKELLLNARPYRIIGVMPSRFGFPSAAEWDMDGKSTEVWVPWAMTPEERAVRTNGNFLATGMARLRPGVSIAQAQAEMTTIAARIDQFHPQLRDWQAAVRPLEFPMLGEARSAFAIFMGAVILVLLIACSNVASLALARANGRTLEMSVRTALGAPRSRLIRQLLAESLCLAGAGGALGVVVALVAIRLLIRIDPGIPRLNEISIDGHVLLVAVCTSLATAVLCGLFPALSASRCTLNEVLKSSGTRTVKGAAGRLHRGLMVAEVALAFVLLTGSGLLIRSFLRMQAVDKGFVPSSTVSMNIQLDARYDKPARQIAFFRDLIDKTSALPGVKAAAAIDHRPYGGGETITLLEVEGHPFDEKQPFETRAVTPQYFDAMRIPLLSGRVFTDDDREGRPPAFLVSRSFAKHYFPGQDAVGKRFRYRGGDNHSDWFTIAGVVGDVRYMRLEDTPPLQIYTCLWQNNNDSAYVVARTELPADSLASSMRTLVRDLDPAVAVADVTTMTDLVAAAAAPRRFETLLVTAFGSVGLFLSLVGLYALMAYFVQQKTSEIGIRMALGAQQRNVLRMVLRQGARLALTGIGLGIVCAWVAMRLMTSLLFEVRPTDAPTFAGVAILFGVVALAACYLPARRATRVDPMVALRYE